MARRAASLGEFTYERRNHIMLRKVKDLTGYTLQSSDGDIGKVKEFYFDDKHWVVRYLVADTGNWLKERLVLLSPYALLNVDKEAQQVAVSLSKKQIEESPSLGTNMPVSQHFEMSYHNYYGWPSYWSGSYAWGNFPLIIREPGKRQTTNLNGKAWNPNLRSTHGVRGYHIQGVDGEIGHVEDYIIDDETWAIQYIVVETRNWIPGRKVLISPRWIDRVSWDESKVFVNLSSEVIKAAPEYSDEILLSREYETRLHGHYNRVGYWIEE
jgi:uncharacterized protein YrrD